MKNENYEKFLEIKILIKNKNHDLALDELEKLYREEPEDITLQFEYLRLLMKICSDKEIENRLQTLQNSDIENTKNFASYGLGKLAVKNMNEEKALEYLLPLTENKNRFYYGSIYELGMLYLHSKNFDKAIKCFETTTLSKRAAESSLARFELGRVYMSLGDYNSAREQFLILFKGTPKEKNLALFKLGQIETKVGNVEKAKEYYSTLRESSYYKDKFRSNLGFAIIEAEHGNIDKARQDFISLLNNSCGNYYFILYELAKIEIKANNYEKARNHLNEIVNGNSEKDKMHAIYELGMLEEKLGNKDKAKEYFQKASSNLIENYNNEYSMIKCGKIAAKSGKYEEALEILEPLLNSENEEIVISAKHELGRLEIKTTNYERAREYIIPVYEKGDLKTKGYAGIELGIIESRLDNFEEAKKYFTSLLDNETVKDIAKFEYGKLLSFSGHDNKAINVFKTIIENADNLSARYELLKIYIRNKKYEAALSELYYLIENNYEIPNVKEVLFYLKYKMDILNNNSNDDYFKNQVINYDKEKAITLIKSNLDMYGNFLETSKFDNDICIEELFEELLDVLPLLNKKNEGIFDKYIYDYNANIGSQYNYKTSFIEITTLTGTDDILFAKPIFSKYLIYRKNRKTKKRVR